MDGGGGGCKGEGIAHMLKRVRNEMGSISVSGQLPTYPSPYPTLTLTCRQLTVVELGGGGRWAVARILIMIHEMYVTL